MGHDASSLERAIASSIGARLGVPIVAHCLGFVGCSAMLPDGERIPIVTWPSERAWEWRVDGLVVTTDVLERYLRGVVGEMGVAQDVRCAPKLRRIAPGDRVECLLANGGKAFVVVREDGSTIVEVELDKRAADARSEVVTPARDDQLTKASRALEDGGGNDDDDDDDASAAADAGVGAPGVESAP
ncbi:MAG: hypothetical protein ACKV2T_06805 [Kofleriaceae bacterium]